MIKSISPFSEIQPGRGNLPSCKPTLSTYVTSVAMNSLRLLQRWIHPSALLLGRAALVEANPFFSTTFNNNSIDIPYITPSVNGSIAFCGVQPGQLFLAVLNTNMSFKWASLGTAGYPAGIVLFDEGRLFVGFEYETNNQYERDVATFLFSSSGDVEWAQIETTPGDDRLFDLTKMSNDAVVMIGSSLFPSKSTDVVVQKMTIDGDRDWKVSFGGPLVEMGRAVAMTRQQLIAAVAQTKSFGIGFTHTLLCLLFSSGQIQSCHLYGTSYDDFFTEISIDFSGNIYLFGGRADELSMFLTKLNSKQRHEWTVAIGFKSDSPQAISAIDGGVVLSFFTVDQLKSGSVLAMVSGDADLLWSDLSGLNNETTFQSFNTLTQENANEVWIGGKSLVQTSLGHHEGIIGQINPCYKPEMCSSEFAPVNLKMHDLSSYYFIQSVVIASNVLNSTSVANLTNYSFSPVVIDFQKECQLNQTKRNLCPNLSSKKNRPSASKSPLDWTTVAIGVGAGAAATIAASILGVYLWRRWDRKRHKNLQKNETEPRTSLDLQEMKAPTPLSPHRVEGRTVINSRFILMSKLNKEQLELLDRQTGIRFDVPFGKKKVKVVIDETGSIKTKIAFDMKDNLFVGVKKIKSNTSLTGPHPSNDSGFIEIVKTFDSKAEEVFYQFFALPNYKVEQAGNPTPNENTSPVADDYPLEENGHNYVNSVQQPIHSDPGHTPTHNYVNGEVNNRDSANHTYVNHVTEQ